MTRMQLSIVLVLAFASAVNAVTREDIEFGDLKCKLPGWPGHPAPSCDPAVPDQCCPGTKCLPDPFDNSHNTCQQTESLTVAEHALTANVLTNHVERLMQEAVGQLKVASTGLYLSNRQQKLEDRQIVTLAQHLVEDYGGVNTNEKGGQSNDWHKYAHGGVVEDAKEKRKDGKDAKVPKDAASKNAAAGQSGNDQGSFDYSKYYNGGGGGGADGQAQGGFDYSKYMPKSIPNNDGDKSTKKGKDKDNSSSNEGKGGFDYSQYYSSGGDPHKKGYTGKESSTQPPSESDAAPAGQGQGQGGFDYSQYWPQQSKHIESNLEDNDEDDILRKAALELLDADMQLRAAKSQARRDALEKIKSIVERIEAVVDRELGESSGTEALSATESPTLVWNDPKDFWSKYIPKMPNQGQPQSGGQGESSYGGIKVNTGDRSPGTLGGPCGKTSYKDFGPCLRQDLVCTGLNAQRPGLCQMHPSVAIALSRTAARNSLVLANEAVKAIKMASMELLVGASPRLNSENDAADSETKGNQIASDSDLTLTMNDSALDIREYSPMTIGVVFLGLGVIGYFCWMNGRRKSYQSLDGWGASRA